MSIVLTTPNWLTNCLQKEASVVKSQAWLADLQKQQEQVFLQRGIPTRREELWKYTDVSYLTKESFISAPIIETKDYANFVAAQRLSQTESVSLVFINGHYAADLSDLKKLPSEVILCNLQDAIAKHPYLIKNYLSNNIDALRYPFASLNMALMNDGVFLYIPKNTLVTVPIHLLFISAEQKDFISNPRNLIIGAENSQVTVLEEYVSINSGAYFTNTVTDIYAENNAEIIYHKIQNEGLQATHVAQLMINQKQDSRVKTFALAKGSRVARDDLQVNLNEKGSVCSLNGFYALHQDGQHIDNHVKVDHLSKHGTSDILYKGILDKRSHGVFNGMIYVHPGAQKTRAHLTNHNLLLSADAAIDTKPEFEIYADDIDKCTHGGTVGQLDDEALFYLRSRGIEKAAAMKILAHAFSAEVLDRVKNTAIAQRMNVILNETGL